jgi:hypothetical protein
VARVGHPRTTERTLQLRPLPTPRVSGEEKLKPSRRRRCARGNTWKAGRHRPDADTRSYPSTLASWSSASSTTWSTEDLPVVQTPWERGQQGGPTREIAHSSLTNEARLLPIGVLWIFAKVSLLQDPNARRDVDWEKTDVEAQAFQGASGQAASFRAHAVTTTLDETAQQALREQKHRRDSLLVAFGCSGCGPASRQGGCLSP